MICKRKFTTNLPPFPTQTQEEMYITCVKSVGEEILDCGRAARAFLSLSNDLIHRYYFRQNLQK